MAKKKNIFVQSGFLLVGLVVGGLAMAFVLMNLWKLVRDDSVPCF